MAKFNLDESGELKKLAEEFEKMASAEKLRDANDEAETQVKEQEAEAAGALPRKTVITIIAVLAVLLLGGLAFLVMHGSGEKKGFKAVPNVVGQDIGRAREVLLAEGFNVRENPDANSKAAPGQVTAQNVSAGTKIQNGGLVILTVAGKGQGAGNKSPIWGPRGAQANRTASPAGTQPGQTPPPDTANTSRVVIPKIEGLDTTKAKSQLEALGLRVEEKTIADSTQQPGVVLASDPKSETMVERGSLVRLSVNTQAATTKSATPQAQAGKQITIPSYYGKPSQEAMDDLRAKGLTPSWRVETAQELRSGYVIRTEPAAGTNVDPAAKVMVVIAQ